MTLQAKAAQVLLVRSTATLTAPPEDAREGSSRRRPVARPKRDGCRAAALAHGRVAEAAAAAGAAGLFVAADEEGGTVMRVKDGVPMCPPPASSGRPRPPSMPRPSRMRLPPACWTKA